MSSNNTPTILTIFGGAGDLTWRKLIPAVHSLFLYQKLKPPFAIFIVDGKSISEPTLLKHFLEGISKFTPEGKPSPADWKEFSEKIHYIKGDFKKKETYKKLRASCEKLQKTWGAKAHLIFYMATPPSLFGVIPQFLHAEGLSQEKESHRIVIEKPFGYDLESSLQLNAQLTQYFDESQIFRIDHFLGKETVQNILALRFANPMFEPLWNRRYIDYVTITVAETVGVEERGGYYDHSGALRDMVQNHLMQLLCLVAMEPMVSFDANEIRNKKVDVLHAVRKLYPESIRNYAVRGQYGAGKMDGKNQKGYRQEQDVHPHSETETFAAIKLYIDNWRWQGVPFYLRTGKKMTRKTSEISIHFRAIPHQSFPPEAALNWKPARLIMAIQPKEGVVLRLQAKYPGSQLFLRAADMQFDYQKAFGTRIPEAYETLLWDVMQNDQTLFMRSDQIEASWQLMMPILDMWKNAPASDFPNYAAGTWGPEEANRLLAIDGHSWPIPIDLEECAI